MPAPEIECGAPASRWLPSSPRTLLTVLLIVIAACGYGPVEEAAGVTHLIRLGDSYRAVLVVRQRVFQQPTGSLNTFPNGGNARVLERRTLQYLIDAEEGVATLLASQEAPDSMWEGFTAYVHGVEGDSAVYVRLTGCPRAPGGECHEALRKKAFFRLTASGRVRDVPFVPSDVRLPPSRGSRAPGERNYVRFGTSGDTITAKLEEDGPYRAIFLLQPDGRLPGIQPVAVERRHGPL
jgi:hypothetical protein